MIDELAADFDENDIEKLKKPQKRFGNSIFNLCSHLYANNGLTLMDHTCLILVMF